MAIELPGPLAKLFGIIAGSDWPQANEDHLREVGQLYDAAATDFDQLEQLFVSLVQTIDSEFQGDAAQQFVASVRQWVEGDDFIGKAREGAAQLGEAARSTATSVEYAKWMIIAQLVELLAELLFLDATSWINPFAAAEEAALIAATRIIVRQIIRKLVTSIIEHTVIEVTMAAAMDRIIQLIQILQGNRSSFDNSLLAQNVEGGLLSGLAGGLMGPGAKWAGSKFGNNLGKTFSSLIGGPSTIGKAGKGFADDITDTVGRHVDDFTTGFSRAGVKNPARIDGFADAVADVFDRHLGGDLGGAAARDLGRDYATTLAAGWGRSDLRTLSDDLTRSLGDSFTGAETRALARDLPSAVSRDVTAHAVGRELGEGAADAVHEGLSEYLGNGFYGLIFDPSHTFTSDFGAFGGAAISSMLSRGGHHLISSTVDLSGLAGLAGAGPLPSITSLVSTPVTSPGPEVPHPATVSGEGPAPTTGNRDVPTDAPSNGSTTPDDGGYGYTPDNPVPTTATAAAGTSSFGPTPPAAGTTSTTDPTGTADSSPVDPPAARTPQQQLDRQGVVLAPPSGATGPDSLADAVTTTLRHDPVWSGHDVSGPWSPPDPSGISVPPGVQLHVLHPDGTFTSHGPVTGIDVHVAQVDGPAGPSYAGTVPQVHVGRPDVSYPGPTRDVFTERRGREVEEILHRGDFEVETVAGEHHVRMYSAVFAPADPGSPFKDVHQGPDGAVTINAKDSSTFWVGGGRPMRAAQWVAKYETQQGAPQPVVRSFLVPLSTYQQISGAAHAERFPGREVMNVDQTGEPNQFGISGAALQAVKAAAVPGSLVSYHADPSTENPDRDGHSFPLQALQDRLGLASGPREFARTPWDPALREKGTGWTSDNRAPELAQKAADLAALAQDVGLVAHGVLDPAHLGPDTLTRRMMTAAHDSTARPWTDLDALPELATRSPEQVDAFIGRLHALASEARIKATLSDDARSPLGDDIWQQAAQGPYPNEFRPATVSELAAPPPAGGATSFAPAADATPPPDPTPPAITPPAITPPAITPPAPATPATAPPPATPPAGPTAHRGDDGTVAVLDFAGTATGPVDVGGVSVDPGGGNPVERPAPWRAAAPLVVVVPARSFDDATAAAFAADVQRHLGAPGGADRRPVLLVAADGSPVSGGLDAIVAAGTGRTVWASTRPTGTTTGANGVTRLTTTGGTSGPAMLHTWTSVSGTGVRSHPVLADDGTPIGTHILTAADSPSRLLGAATTASSSYLSSDAHGTSTRTWSATPGGSVPRVVVALHASPQGFELTVGHHATRTVDGAELAAHLADDLPTTGPFDVLLIACDAATAPSTVGGTGGISPAQQFANALGGRGVRQVVAATGTVTAHPGTYGGGLTVSPDAQGRAGRFVNLRPDPDDATLAGTAQALGLAHGPDTARHLRDVVRTHRAFDGVLPDDPDTARALVDLVTLTPGDGLDAPGLERFAGDLFGPTATAAVGGTALDPDALVADAVAATVRARGLANGTPTPAQVAAAALERSRDGLTGHGVAGRPERDAAAALLRPALPAAWSTAVGADGAGATPDQTRVLDAVHDLGAALLAQGATPADVGATAAHWLSLLTPDGSTVTLGSLPAAPTAPLPAATTPGSFGRSAPDVGDLDRALATPTDTPDEIAARTADLRTLAAIGRRELGLRGRFDALAAAQLHAAMTGGPVPGDGLAAARVLRERLPRATAAAAGAPRGWSTLGGRWSSGPRLADLTAAAHEHAAGQVRTATTGPRIGAAPLAPTAAPSASLAAALDEGAVRLADPDGIAAAVLAAAPAGLVPRPAARTALRELLADPQRLQQAFVRDEGGDGLALPLTATDGTSWTVRVRLAADPVATADRPVAAAAGADQSADVVPGPPKTSLSSSSPVTGGSAVDRHNRTVRLAVPVAPVGPTGVTASVELGWHAGDLASRTSRTAKLDAAALHADRSTRRDVTADLTVTASWSAAARPGPATDVVLTAPDAVSATLPTWSEPGGGSGHHLPPTLPTATPAAGGTATARPLPAGTVVTVAGTTADRAALLDAVTAAAGRADAGAEERARWAAQLTEADLRRHLSAHPDGPLTVQVGDRRVQLSARLDPTAPLRLVREAATQELGGDHTGTTAGSRAASRTTGWELALTLGAGIPGLPSGHSLFPTGRLGGSRLRTTEDTVTREQRTKTGTARRTPAGRYTGRLVVEVASDRSATPAAVPLQVGAIVGRDVARELAGWAPLESDAVTTPGASPLAPGARTLGPHRVETLTTTAGDAVLDRVRAELTRRHPGLLPTGARPGRRQRANEQRLREALADPRLREGIAPLLGGRAPEVRLDAGWWSPDVRVRVDATLGVGEVTGRRFGLDVEFTDTTVATSAAGTSTTTSVDAGVTATGGPGGVVGSLTAGVGHSRTGGRSESRTTSTATTLVATGRHLVADHDVAFTVTAVRGSRAPVTLVDAAPGRVSLLLPGSGQTASTAVADHPVTDLDDARGVATALGGAPRAGRARPGPALPAVTWAGDSRGVRDLVAHTLGRVRHTPSPSVAAALDGLADDTLTAGRSAASGPGLGLTGLIATSSVGGLVGGAHVLRDRSIAAATHLRVVAERVVGVRQGLVGSTDSDRTAWTSTSGHSTATTLTGALGGSGTGAGTVAASGVPAASWGHTLSARSGTRSVQVTVGTGTISGPRTLLERRHDAEVTVGVTAAAHGPLADRRSAAASRRIDDALHSLEPVDDRPQDGLPATTPPPLDTAPATAVPMLQPATGRLDASAALAALRADLPAGPAHEALFAADRPPAAGLDGLRDLLAGDGLRAARRRLLTADGVTTHVGGVEVRARLVETGRRGLGVDDDVELTATRDAEVAVKQTRTGGDSLTVRVPLSLGAGPGSGPADGQARVGGSAKAARTDATGATTTSTTSTKVSVKDATVRQRVQYALHLEVTTPGGTPTAVAAPAGALDETTPAGLFAAPAATGRTTALAGTAKDLLGASDVAVVAVDGGPGLPAAARPVGPDGLPHLLVDAVVTGSSALAAGADGRPDGSGSLATPELGLDRARVVAMLDKTSVRHRTTAVGSTESSHSATVEANATAGAVVRDVADPGPAGHRGGLTATGPGTSRTVDATAPGESGSLTTTVTPRGRAVVLQVPVRWGADGAEGTATVVVGERTARGLGLLGADGTPVGGVVGDATAQALTAHAAAAKAAGAAAATRRTARDDVLAARADLATAWAEQRTAAAGRPTTRQAAARALASRSELLATRLQRLADADDRLTRAHAALAGAPATAPVATDPPLPVPDHAAWAAAHAHDLGAPSAPLWRTPADEHTATRQVLVHDGWLAADALGRRHAAALAEAPRTPATAALGQDFAAAADRAAQLAATAPELPLPPQWLPPARPAAAPAVAPADPPVLDLQPGDTTARPLAGPAAGAGTVFDVLPGTGDGEGFFRALAAQAPDVSPGAGVGTGPQAWRDRLAHDLDALADRPADVLHHALAVDRHEPFTGAELDALAAGHPDVLAAFTAEQLRELRGGGTLTGPLPPAVAARVLASVTATPGRFDSAAADLWPPLAARALGRPVVVVGAEGTALARFGATGDDVPPVVLLLRDGRWDTLVPRAAELDPLGGLPVTDLAAPPPTDAARRPTATAPADGSEPADGTDTPPARPVARPTTDTTPAPERTGLQAEIAAALAGSGPSTLERLP